MYNNDVHMGVSKNGGTPKMDGLQWKTLFKWDDFGGTTIFGNIHINEYLPQEM